MNLTRFQGMLVLLVVIGCNQNGSTTGLIDEEESNILGGWTSTEIGGNDIGDHLKGFEYVFRSDGSFTATATMSDDEVQSVDGTYKVLPSAIEMTIPDQGTAQMPYTLSEDLLTLNDPELDSWIKLRRRNPVEQSTSADEDKPRR